jgi:hypothetical protein
LTVLFCFATIGCEAQATKAPNKITPPAAAAAPPSLEELARTDHVALLEKCLDHYRQNYHAYTCVFRKQERLDGSLRPEQKVAIRFREEPFSVAMEWLENAPAADRLLYVEDKYNGQMLVRPSFVLARGLTIRKDPEAKDVLKQTLRPVTRFGFKRGLTHLIKVYRHARQSGELEAKFEGYAQLDGRTVLLLKRILPDKPEYPAPVTEIYVDTEWLVPLCIRAYETDGTLQANYVYQDVTFNPSLSDEDFTPASLDMAPVDEE